MNFVLTFSLVPLMLVCRIFCLYVSFFGLLCYNGCSRSIYFLLFDYIILFPLSSYVSLVSYFWLFQPFLFVWDPRLFSIMSFVFATFVWFACFYLILYVLSVLSFLSFHRFYSFLSFLSFYRFCCFYPFLSFLSYFRI